MTDSPAAELARMLAQGGDSAHLLPRLHRQIARLMDARCSLVLAIDPETRERVATSGVGAPPEGVRLTQTEAQELDRALGDGAVAVIEDLALTCPPLAQALKVPRLILARVALHDRPALLAIGRAADRQAPDLQIAAEAANALAVGIEWMHLRRAGELQGRLRDIVLAFSGAVTSTRSLAAGFEALCREVNTLFEARRTSIWMHARSWHQLTLDGSSDPVHVASGAVVTVDDPQSVAARALRLEGPQFDWQPGASGTRGALSLLIPLRGRRRALGSVVVEDCRGGPGERRLCLEAARDFGRQLSSTIDNVQLLTEVLGSHRELEETFDSLADLVLACDLEQRVTYINLAFAARVGRSLDDVRARPLATLVGPDLGAWISAPAQVSTAGTSAPTTRHIEDPVLKGTFSVTVTSLINQDGQQTGTVVVARDVTEQVRLDAERASLRQRLAQSEKLAALGQFVAGIAHELNNPLQVVLGHIELMRRAGKLTRAQRRDLQTVYREADRAAKIVRSLLVFAGSGRRLRQRCRLNTLVSRTLALRAARLRSAGIEVVRRFDQRQPTVVGDALLLQQAFFNIIVNAEQAMAGREHRLLEVTTVLAGGGEWAIVRIRDSGTGLSEAVLSRVFEPYFTTKDVGQGTGLGLAITYGIVQDHSGQIHAENHPQGGAVFTIELPTDKLVIK